MNLVNQSPNSLAQQHHNAAIDWTNISTLMKAQAKVRGWSEQVDVNLDQIIDQEWSNAIQASRDLLGACDVLDQLEERENLRLINRLIAIHMKHVQAERFGK